MDGESLLSRLEAAGLVEDAGDEVYPSDAFLDERSALVASGEAIEAPAWLDPEEAGDEGLRRNAVAVDRVATGLDEEERAVAARAMASLEDPPTATLAPDGFVPIHADDVPGFVAAHRASVVFVWKEESDSCAAMSETLSKVQDLPTVDGSVGLGAVCVGDGADILRRRYDVGILPTTLFFVGGATDSRFIGVREFDAVERELEIVTTAAD